MINVAIIVAIVVASYSLGLLPFFSRSLCTIAFMLPATEKVTCEGSHKYEDIPNMCSKDVAKCEAAVNITLELEIGVCPPGVWIKWFRFDTNQNAWKELSEKTLNSGTVIFFPPNEVSTHMTGCYKANCSYDDEQLAEYFNLVVKPAVLPEPIEMIKVEKHEKPNTFILKNIKPVFKKGSSGEICINATSIGWPTPKYEWFIKHHEQEDDKYIKITNNLACTYVKTPESACFIVTCNNYKEDHIMDFECKVTNIAGSITIRETLNLSRLRTQSPWFIKGVPNIQSQGDITLDKSNGLYKGTAHCAAIGSRLHHENAMSYFVCEVTKDAIAKTLPCLLYRQLTNACLQCPDNPGIKVTAPDNTYNLSYEKIPDDETGTVASCKMSYATRNKEKSNRVFMCIAAENNKATDNSDSDSFPQEIAIFSFNSTKLNPSNIISAIVGGVLGGLVVLYIIIISVIYIIRRKRITPSTPSIPGTPSTIASDRDERETISSSYGSTDSTLPLSSYTSSISDTSENTKLGEELRVIVNNARWQRLVKENLYIDCDMMAKMKEKCLLNDEQYVRLLDMIRNRTEKQDIANAFLNIMEQDWSRNIFLEQLKTLTKILSETEDRGNKYLVKKFQQKLNDHGIHNELSTSSSY